MSLVLSCTISAAVFQPAAKWQPNEEIQSVTVTIAASRGLQSDDLLGLDLGWGFPLWLCSPDLQAGNVPFGMRPHAVQVSAPADAAGQHALTFVFRRDGNREVDALRTEQLFRSLRVSDVSRIALLGHARNWQLKSFTVLLNDKLLATQSGLSVGPTAVEASQSADGAEAQAAQLDALRLEIADLRVLCDRGFATAAQHAQLLALEQQLAQRILPAPTTSVFTGQPWYVHDAFQPLDRTGTPLKSVRATVWTAPVAGADSSNFVYLGIGGHKFPLFSPEHPPRVGIGPQSIDIDLVAMPLVPADFRGLTLGMLASGQPQGAQPDAWQPERWTLEVDGQLAYDSENYPLDKKSLATIRLIPPAHISAAGQVVANSQPIAREFSLWEPGKSLGLDPQTGEPLPDTPPTPQPPTPQPPTPQPPSPAEPTTVVTV